MRLWLDRYGFGRDSTLGVLSISENDEEPVRECFTIEDERRAEKLPGETCIPTGVYVLKLRTEGGLHEKYKARFPEMHRGMLWLQNVPEFTYVYIHIGNSDDDTEGCPLVVTTPFCKPDGEFTGGESTRAYVKLYRRVMEAVDRGEEVVVSVTERGP